MSVSANVSCDTKSDLPDRSVAALQGDIRWVPTLSGAEIYTYRQAAVVLWTNLHVGSLQRSMLPRLQPPLCCSHLPLSAVALMQRWWHPKSAAEQHCSLRCVREMRPPHPWGYCCCSWCDSLSRSWSRGRIVRRSPVCGSPGLRRKPFDRANTAPAGGEPPCCW